MVAVIAACGSLPLENSQSFRPLCLSNTTIQQDQALMLKPPPSLLFVLCMPKHKIQASLGPSLMHAGNEAFRASTQLGCSYLPCCAKEKLASPQGHSSRCLKTDVPKNQIHMQEEMTWAC